MEKNLVSPTALILLLWILRAYPKIISEVPEKSGVEAFAKIFPAPFRNFGICSKPRFLGRDKILRLGPMKGASQKPHLGWPESSPSAVI
jgi:hypothetical protein